MPRPHPFRLHVCLAALATVTSLLSTACPFPGEYREPPPPTANVIGPRMVVMAANDSMDVVINIAIADRQDEDLDVQYSVRTGSRYDEAGPVPDVATFSMDDSIGSIENPWRTLLTVDTRAGVEPGVYDYVIDATLEGRDTTVVNSSRLRILVIPTGGASATGTVAQIAAGVGHTLVLLDDGTVWAFGDNRYGQLGDGTLIDRSAPVQVTGISSAVVAIAAGHEHSVALTADGRIHTWGRRGRIGMSIERLPPGTCGVTRFGLDERQQTFLVPRELAVSITQSQCTYALQYVEGVTAIGAGDDHALALVASGVLGWGANAHGQTRGFLEDIGFLPERPTELIGGGEFSLALMPSGQLWGWGANDSSQLGFGPAQDVREPWEVGFTGVVEQVAAGRIFNVALRRGERGYIAWGNNSSGQLGDGTIDSRDIPAVLSPQLDIRSIAAGERHVIAALANGDVYAWGDNSSQQLGFETTGLRQLTPQRIPGVDNIGTVQAGLVHSLGEERGCGTIWAWGRNLAGQLGRGHVSVDEVDPLPVYGLAEQGLPQGCDVGLHVWQRGAGTITTDMDDFGVDGCAESYCGAPIPVDSVVQLTATPDAGRAFVRWLGDCSGTTPTVSVTLDESRSCIAVYSGGIDLPPVPVISFSPDPPVQHAPVTFDATASNDDGTIVSYLWTFEPRQTRSGPVATHRFPFPGPETVRLRVTDDAGRSTETSIVVDVQQSGEDVFRIIFAGTGAGRVVSDVPGLDCTATCTASFPRGTTLFLTPIPAPGSTFTRWGSIPIDPPVSDCDQDFGEEGCQVSGNLLTREVRVYFD